MHVSVLMCECVYLCVSSQLYMFICWMCVCVCVLVNMYVLNGMKASNFKIKHVGVEEMEKAGWFFLPCPSLCLLIESRLEDPPV